ncbi:hypothetical protein EUGRSUZ_B01097 [Eucalyptus grandis]|uniref:Uncharacterized protein n=2 Tax=Eucalyptus grandis TaxID=71139 RepID=A0ACC3LP39_EUCGR|nr:hypothetical protein EUGRSUZ_B01097 [Eucalyptus grandis]
MWCFPAFLNSHATRTRNALGGPLLYSHCSSMGMDNGPSDVQLAPCIRRYGISHVTPSVRVNPPFVIIRMDDREKPTTL